MNMMDELLCRLLWVQLQSLGLLREKESVFANLKTQNGLLDSFDRWLEESLAILARNHYITRSGELYRVNEQASMDKVAVWQEWDRQKGPWLEDPNTKAQVVLAEKMLRALPEILTGKISATSIMFPNSSMELVEGIYKHNSVADYFNEVLAGTVVAYIQERLSQEPSAQVQIIEIGAGTGGTSTIVFQKLMPYREHIQEYCYTDISKAFLMFAKEKYGPENPYLTYQIFDVEAPVAGQKINPGGYDIAIATNVLHATKDIRQTIRNAKAVLSRNGLLLINEMSNNLLFTHLTFGLLEGWWLYEDPELRIPGCPGLYPETWREVLESEGFRSVFFPAETAHSLGQQIVAAESDGMIRQKQAPKPAVLLVKPEGKTGRPFTGKILPQSGIQDKQPALSPTKIRSRDVDLTVSMVEEHVRDIIIEKLSESLKMAADMIDVDESFADYGIDSILGVNLIQTINQSLPIELQTVDIFDYSSVNQLTKYILSQYQDVIAATLKQTGGNQELPHMGHAVTGVNQAQAPVQFEPRPVLRKEGLVEAGIPKQAGSGKVMTREPIAIIGMSGQFAKSKTVHEFWEHLAHGDDLIETISRWDLSRYYSEKTDYCNYGSFLDDFDRFDPLFFNISGLEATYMDPQQRVFLEEAWRALEDAGYAGAGIQGCPCGVYVGCGGRDYPLAENPPPQAFWGNSEAVIPARISYYLDLQGPAITVNTACSSSLVAMHLACQGLWSGETQMALAGGVFVQCTPVFHLFCDHSGMLSRKGRCFTFDDRADGIVLGEGVGVIVLKRLREAVSDGDHIYGVIRGSGINQDGTTNGITAPSLNSQERLERYVYDTFQIDPQRIQMAEAHGTGTKLGDPIEYHALSRAFRKYTDKQEYCAIGSMKTNIGHSVAAAGVAGVIKILLSLQHKQIPPSLHFQSGNSHIQFKGSPFYVNTHLKDWDVEPGVKRCAVISSFGFSGTNAHLAIEEAPDIERRHSEKPGYLIALSARTAEQLRSQVNQLVRHCEQEPRIDCGNMSFTLLLGRKHFNHRLACIVSSPQELVILFKKWLENGKPPQMYLSEPFEKEHREQASLKRYGNQCIQNCRTAAQARDYLENMATIAELYIQGYTLEFEQLFADEPYSRISLPTYPFAGERYWVPEQEVNLSRNGAKGNSAMSAVIHPLLHQNTSDLYEQRFSSTFKGREFFLAAHMVKGRPVIPGVVYLEMARAAVDSSTGNLATRTLEEGRSGIRLKRIVWVQPVALEELPAQIHIRLFPGDNGEIEYEIYSESQAIDTDPIIHCHGAAELIPVVNNPTVDLTALQTEFDDQPLDPAQYYESFRDMGVDYGKEYQGIEKVYVGTGRLLAKLSLPVSVSNTMDQFVLHPSIIDSALQASIGSLINTRDTINKADLKPFLPYTIQVLEVFGSCTPVMWALIRYNGQRAPENKVPTGGLGTQFDIDLCDDQGKVWVRFQGFSVAEPNGANDLKRSNDNIETMMFYPVWQEQAIIPESVTKTIYHQYLAICCELEKVSRETIETQMNEVAQTCRCLVLQSPLKVIEQRFENYAAQAFEEIKNILIEKPQGKILIQIIVPFQREQQLFAALSGLLKTARLENPKFTTQLIEVEAMEDAAGIAGKLIENSRCPMDSRIRYQDGQRWIIHWNEMEVTREAVSLPWKDGGIYLITGGAGGLGFIFAREIIQKVKDPTLILIGRSPLDEEKQAKLRELQALNALIEYRPMDVAQKKAVEDLIQDIRTEFGGLNGIIHAAGVIRDNYIHNKTKEELLEVFAPKVHGLVNLDEAAKDLPLDLFILFSSGSGVMGNPAQADYSMANAFMDSYAGYRNTLVASKQRHGQTLSINWPLWKEGGMQVDEETETMMMRNIGMIAMQTSTGIQALYQSFASLKAQTMVIEGNLKRVKQKFSFISDNTVAPSRDNLTIPDNAIKIETSSLIHKVLADLTQIVSELVKLNVQDIDGNTELSQYGFDSLMFTEFINQINRKYQLELTPTIFFEYSTLQHLAGYLFKEYPALFRTQFLPTKAESPPPAIKNKLEQRRPNPKRSRFAGHVMGAASKSNPAVPEPIAIIGMSGIFPMARDVDEFWKNLVEGRDCITEIPKSRWDWREYYGDPTKEANKSNIKWGGFIDGVDEFDTKFFGISPREAKLMDPQQRLLMTYVWKVMEDAGYSAQSIAGTKTAIFVGTTDSGYGFLTSKANIAIEGYFSTGMVPSMGPNRMSYYLDLHGPSEPVETACSSSLIAVHRAVCAIESGNCEMAIAGGVNCIVSPEAHIGVNKAGMLCEDGRCKTFSDKANGYVRGEAVGLLFLKKLKDAELAGDHIYGVILGSAENHGGRANSLTAPNPKAQAELLVTAYTKSGIDPRTVTFIEAHGTGTELGDPIEINGLKAAFKELYQAAGEYQVTDPHCGLSSVKTNIGHSEYAAGIAGLIKVLLQFKHKTLVKNLHCDTINPYIKLNNSPFYIVQETKEWKPVQDEKGRDLPRRAGVSSFGFGGSNAHIVIEEYIPKDQNRHPRAGTSQNRAVPERFMIVLSAKNETGLKEQARQLLAAIGEQQLSDSVLADMAYTLQIGRDTMEERLGCCIETIRELEQKLAGFLEDKEDIPEFYRGQAKRNKENLAGLTADEDMAQTIDAWIQKGKYGKLLDLWVRGLAFDWNRLYGDNKPCRVSLPTYPFARERHWVLDMDTHATGNRPTVDLKDTPSIQTSLPQNPSVFSGPQARPAFAPQPLQTTNIAETNFPNILHKPVGISLSSFSDTPVFNKPANKIQSSVSLLSIVSSLPSPGSNEIFEPATHVPTAAAAESIQEELAASLANILAMKRADIDMNTRLIDLGLDSIISLEWIQAINKQYGTTISVSQIYDYPNIRLLAGFLEQELKKQNPRFPGNSAASFPNKPVREITLPSPGSAPVRFTTTSMVTASKSIETKEYFDPRPLAIPVQLLQEELAVSLAEILNMKRSDIDPDARLIDIGLDSIVGVEWIRAVNQRYYTEIPANIIYNYPNIREFAGFLAGELNKDQGESNQQIKSIPSPSLHELIQQVQQGTMNIEEADRLLQQISLINKDKGELP